jgi:hypothetical protein
LLSQNATFYCYVKERFGVDPAAMGSAMSAQAMANAVVGGLVLGPVTAALPEEDLVCGCLVFIVAFSVAGAVQLL